MTNWTFNRMGTAKSSYELNFLNIHNLILSRATFNFPEKANNLKQFSRQILKIQCALAELLRLK